MLGEIREPSLNNELALYTNTHLRNNCQWFKEWVKWMASL